MLMKSYLKRFLQAKKAVTAIEFALLAPLFFLLFVGIIEFGITIFVDSAINTALRTVAREGAAQQMTSGRAQEILQQHMAGTYRAPGAGMTFCAVAIPIDNPEAELTMLEAAANHIRTRPEVPLTGCDTSFPDTHSGAIVIYRMTYEWGGFTRIMSQFLPDPIYAFTVIRNENWDDTP